jgi:2,3-diketo-5-methylthio-1-phosphopentane phosphatase
MPKIRLSSLSNCVVFFDFDNTITLFDLLDDIIERFSVDTKWVALENAWRTGRISSRDCLEGQLRSVRVSKKDLLQYLSQIRIDPHFYRLFAMLKREGMKPVILSDSFTPIIEALLKNNGIKGVKVYANRLRFYKSRLIPSFPYKNKRCPLCAHCKKKSLQRKDVRNKIILYIGDGLSDICPAGCADLVFAKGELLNHFRKTKRLCLAYSSLGDITNYFRGLEK